MNVSRDKVTRHAVIWAVVLATAALDLATKHWASASLATDQHLLPVQGTGGTVGDAVRARFNELDDNELVGTVVKVVMGRSYAPEDLVFGPAFADTTAFHVFVDGDLTGPARRIERNDHIAIERWLVRAAPEMGFEAARKAVAARLSGVTLRDFLKAKMPWLSAEQLDRTIRGGLFPVLRGSDTVSPSARAEPGDLYLLSHREIVLIPGHLDFSYAENPFGAWGILSGMDQGVRRTIFLVFSVLAILAIAYLVVRPPSASFASVVTLAAILGGAIGNVVERISPGHVVDFIHMYWGDSHWPRYNVADIAITIGVLLLLFASGKRPASDKGKSR